MSEWFHVGQKVVCVDDEPIPVGTVYGAWIISPRPDDHLGPVKGRFYTVRRVGRCFMDGEPVVWLDEIVRPAMWDEPEEPGWLLSRFRPLRGKTLRSRQR